MNRCRKSLKRARKAAETKRNVIEFLTREDNCHAMPGKKDHIKGDQVYYLVDTLNNLHEKFIRENTNVAISRATFCRYRPKHARLSKFMQRRVCLCLQHTNIALKLEGAKVLPRSTTSLLEMSEEDIKEKCKDVPEYIRYHSWQKEALIHKEKKISKVKLRAKKTARENFVAELLSDLPSFREHCNTVETQHREIRYLRDNLSPKELVCQLDYSENWAAKYMDEISSAYYDRIQITVHPMVVSSRGKDGQSKTKCYVGVSEVTNHSAPTTLAFLSKLIPMIKEEYPEATTMHFVSDSPSSQYRNQKICNLIANFHQIFKMQASWSWLEVGHGKGACDGVGGALKRRADSLVKQRKIISSADDFVEEIEKTETSITIIKVTEKEVKNSADFIATWPLKPVKGLLRSHMIAAIEDRLMQRKTSCFHESCYKAGSFQQGCPGWSDTSLMLNTMDMDNMDQISDVEMETVEIEDSEETEETEDHEETRRNQPETVTRSRDADSDSETETETLSNLRKTLMKEGVYITWAYGKRWYVGIITQDHGNEITVSFMTPSRGKWKWGKEDILTISKDEVITIISGLTQQGDVYELRAAEKIAADRKFDNTCI